MRKVLIVEDEEIIRRGLVDTIDWSGMGCVVVGEAADGRAGLEMIRSLHPDIVMTDIRMPRMDGIEMARAARAEGILGARVFFTSYSDFTYAREAIRLDAADYLLKPVDERELAKLMEKLTAGVQGDDAPGVPLPVALPVAPLPWQDWLADEGMNPYVRQTMQRIRQSFAERLSIERLADEFGVSASYLSRKFKEAAHQTFGEALTRQRLYMAARQLATGIYRVYEVAEQNGFGDYKNFCTVFKKYAGESPTDFMKHCKKQGLEIKQDVSTMI